VSGYGEGGKTYNMQFSLRTFLFGVGLTKFPFCEYHSWWFFFYAEMDSHFVCSVVGSACCCLDLFLFFFVLAFGRLFL
jgi:hypothetical protein